MKVKSLTAFALTLSLSLGAAPGRAEDQRQVVSRAEVDQALSARTRADEASRASIRDLLDRDEVKAMAGDMGLDLRRAESSVASLEGRELERVAERAAVANDLLIGGGTGDIQINIVVLLLIIIIVILLVQG